MRLVEGFRFVALGYALLVLLIAPSWLSADEVPSGVPTPTVDVPTGAVREAVPEVAAEKPAATAVDTDEPKAEPAHDRKKRKQKANTSANVSKQPAEKREPVAKTAASASVTIRDFAFSPSTVTVNEGDTVTWTNEDAAAHTATADDGSFDTGTLRKGESGSATFTQAGSFSYFCTPHPDMKGTVVVQASSAGSGSGDGSGSGSGSGSGDGGTAGSNGSAVAGDDANSTGSGSSLPTTGRELLSIVLLGLATLGVGMLLRRREET